MKCSSYAGNSRLPRIFFISLMFKKKLNNADSIYHIYLYISSTIRILTYTQVYNYGIHFIKNIKGKGLCSHMWLFACCSVSEITPKDVHWILMTNSIKI